MHRKLLQLNSSTMKTKDTEKASLPVLNGITESRTATETVNSTLRLSSNGEEYNGLDPSQHCSPVLCRSSGGSIRFPHWIPDSIIKFSSTRNHGFGEDASSSGHHPEFTKNQTSRDAALGSSFENSNEANAALQLKIRPPTELVDVKMKRPMQEDSISANLVSEREAFSFSLSGSTSIMKFDNTLWLDSLDQSQPNCVQESFNKAMNFHHSALLPTQLRLFEPGTTEEIAGGYRRYCQTTQNLFTTNKSDDAILSKQNTTLTSMVTEVSGNNSSRIQRLPPLFAQCNTGMKRKELSNNHSNEGNRHLQNDGTSSGVQEHIGSSHELEMKSSYREAGIPLKKARSLDIKTGLLALEAVVLSSENKCRNYQEDRSMESCSNTWINRLKQTSSTSSNQGSKTWKPSEDSSHDKASLFEKEHEQERGNYCKEPLLSHPWIKRLQREGYSPNGTLSFCGSQCLKPDSDEFPKKQCPSMAAMALVGRTMNGVKSYETRKRGPLTLWHTTPL